MFTLWSHCYSNVLSSTCFSQPLHYAVEGGGGRLGGGPSGGPGSDEEKEVGCCCSCCVCVHVCDGVVCRCFYANKADLAGLLYRVVAKWLLHLIHNTHLLTLTLL